MAIVQTPSSKKTAAKTAAKTVAKTAAKAAVAVKAPKAAAPAAKKVQAKATATKTPAKQTVAKPNKAGTLGNGRKTSVTPEERHRMIEMAAYYRAERNGFSCDDQDCWLQAEAEIDSLLDRVNYPMQ